MCIIHIYSFPWQFSIKRFIVRAANYSHLTYYLKENYLNLNQRLHDTALNNYSGESTKTTKPSANGFDDLGIASYYHPSLTTVRQPIYQLGHSATKMLLKLIQGDGKVDSEILEPELIARDSTSRAQN